MADSDVRFSDFNDSSPEDTDDDDYDPHAEGYIVSVPGAHSESSYGYEMVKRF